MPIRNVISARIARVLFLCTRRPRAGRRRPGVLGRNVSARLCPRNSSRAPLLSKTFARRTRRALNAIATGRNNRFVFVLHEFVRRRHPTRLRTHAKKTIDTLFIVSKTRSRRVDPTRLSRLRLLRRFRRDRNRSVHGNILSSRRPVADLLIRGALG